MPKEFNFKVKPPLKRAAQRIPCLVSFRPVCGPSPMGREIGSNKAGGGNSVLEGSWFDIEMTVVKDDGRNRIVGAQHSEEVNEHIQAPQGGGIY